MGNLNSRSRCRGSRRPSSGGRALAWSEAASTEHVKGASPPQRAESRWNHESRPEAACASVSRASRRERRDSPHASTATALASIPDGGQRRPAVTVRSICDLRLGDVGRGWSHGEARVDPLLSCGATEAWSGSRPTDNSGDVARRPLHVLDGDDPSRAENPTGWREPAFT